MVTADPSDGTTATITIDENTGDVMQGSITGTCLTFFNGQEFLRNFDMNFRSGDLMSENAICGEQ